MISENPSVALRIRNESFELYSKHFALFFRIARNKNPLAEEPELLIKVSEIAAHLAVTNHNYMADLIKGKCVLGEDEKELGKVNVESYLKDLGFCVGDEEDYGS